MAVSQAAEPRVVHAEATTTPLPPIKELPAGIDWAAFSAQLFPNGRRHDLDAIAAYFAYKQLPRIAEREAAAEAVEAWEGEGGSTPSPLLDEPG